MAHVESYRLRDGRKRYRARWVGVDGRERSRSFALKKDADRFVLEQRRRASLGALYQAPPETLGEFVAGWLDRYALRVRASTLERVHEVRQHLEVFARVPTRRDPPGRGRGPHRRACEARTSAGRARARAAQADPREREGARPPRRRGRLPRQGSAPRPAEMRFLEWAEVEELAANTVAPYGNMVLLAALTGLRQGELFALRDRNVDLEAKTVHVENGVYKGEFCR